MDALGDGNEFSDGEELGEGLSEAVDDAPADDATDGLPDGDSDADASAVAAAAGAGAAAALVVDGDGVAADDGAPTARAAIFGTFVDCAGSFGTYPDPRPGVRAAAEVADVTRFVIVGGCSDAEPGAAADTVAVNVSPLGSLTDGITTGTRHAATSGVVTAHAGYATNRSRSLKAPPKESAKAA